MRRLIQSIKVAIAAIALASSITTDSRAQSAPPPSPMTIVIYEAGLAWKEGKPPAEQNMGLHFAYVGELFKAGKVVAYGPQTDAVRGFYVLAGAEPSVADSFIKGDPSVKTGVLKPASRLSWGVAVNGFAPDKKGESYFIMRYAAGPNWVKGKTLTEQAIGPHFGYMIEQAKKGVVIAAGPSMAGDEGLYVVRGSKAGVDALIAADPGVKDGLFKPQVFGWNVLAMQASK
jgi:hypothetical protein